MSIEKIIFFFFCLLAFIVVIAKIKDGIKEYIKKQDAKYLEFTSDKAKELLSNDELIKCLKGIEKAVKKGETAYYPTELSFNTQKQLEEMGYYVNRIMLFGNYVSVAIHLECPFKKQERKK